MSYKFFTNKDCEYYPCHNMNSINCLFCFCPLYHIKDCGGNYKITDKGWKNCSQCEIPHLPEGYDHIINEIKKEFQ